MPPPDPPAPAVVIETDRVVFFIECLRHGSRIFYHDSNCRVLIFYVNVLLIQVAAPSTHTRGRDPAFSDTGTVGESGRLNRLAYIRWGFNPRNQQISDARIKHLPDERRVIPRKSNKQFGPRYLGCTCQILERLTILGCWADVLIIGPNEVESHLTVHLYNRRFVGNCLCSEDDSVVRKSLQDVVILSHTFRI